MLIAGVPTRVAVDFTAGKCLEANGQVTTGQVATAHGVDSRSLQVELKSGSSSSSSELSSTKALKHNDVDFKYLKYLLCSNSVDNVWLSPRNIIKWTSKTGVCVVGLFVHFESLTFISLYCTSI